MNASDVIGIAILFLMIVFYIKDSALLSGLKTVIKKYWTPPEGYELLDVRRVSFFKRPKTLIAVDSFGQHGSVFKITIQNKNNGVKKGWLLLNFGGITGMTVRSSEVVWEEDKPELNSDFTLNNIVYLGINGLLIALFCLIMLSLLFYKESTFLFECIILAVAALAVLLVLNIVSNRRKKSV